MVQSQNDTVYATVGLYDNPAAAGACNGGTQLIPGSYDQGEADLVRPELHVHHRPEQGDCLGRGRPVVHRLQVPGHRRQRQRGRSPSGLGPDRAGSGRPPEGRRHPDRPDRHLPDRGRAGCRG
ncbi:hypothetical protein H1235_03485 [Pseudoxanthomonas sp. NC8]|nr:hypothetical protein H1235_03485 [Pseudoxanthomonas sp. NC8]